jgi:hypothetical protein
MYSFQVELILSLKIASNIKLEIVAFNFIIDFYTQIYCSTPFCINISMYKSF